MKPHPSVMLSAMAAVLASGALVVAILAATVFDDSGQSAGPSASAPSAQAGGTIEWQMLYLTVAHGDPKVAGGPASGFVKQDQCINAGCTSYAPCVSAPEPGSTCNWQYVRRDGSIGALKVVLRAYPVQGSAVQWTGCGSLNGPYLCERSLPGPSVKATFVPIPKG